MGASKSKAKTTKELSVEDSNSRHSSSLQEESSTESSRESKEQLSPPPSPPCPDVLKAYPAYSSPLIHSLSTQTVASSLSSASYHSALPVLSSAVSADTPLTRIPPLQGNEPKWVRKFSETENQGRVHSATVSAVNPSSRSVTVEWFERGETKGKEIEFDAVFSLNPDYQPQDRKLMPPPSKYEKDDESSMSEETDVEYISNAKKKPRGALRGSGRFLRSTHINLPAVYRSQNSSALSSSNLPRPPGGQIHNQVLRSQSTSRLSMPTRGQNAAAAPNARNKDKVRPSYIVRPQNGAAPLPAVKQSGPSPARSTENISTSTVSKGTANASSKPRRSNVVKEVDRIQKNREERRAKQAEKKEEKEALMNIDPGNPNWEFLNMIREFRQQLDFCPLKDGDPMEEHQITVAVRKRPLNKKENTRKEVDVITIPKKDILYVHEPKTKVDLTKYVENQGFRFDYAFDESCKNDLVYKYTARPLVHTIFEGGMATCFAYGQTGSGKTHTMGGDFQGKNQDCTKGIYALAAKDVFSLLKSPKFRNLNLQVSASFFEIYGGKVFDLLNEKKKLRVLEDGKQVVQVVGLQERICQSVEDVLSLIMLGSQVRTSGQTAANNQSSRSHAVLQIILRNLDKIERQNDRHYKLHGKFSLIDLAGNERGADTSSANRQTRMEGAEINKSLLALKECIRALGRKGAHLPFRASKLTQVLRDSFIGEKSKTCMIAMISPGVFSCEHTLNTLRYADRVKELGADSESKGYSSEKLNEENGIMNEDDYSHLSHTNQEDMSADQQVFQQALGALQEAEEEVVEYHGQYFTHRDNMDKMLIPLYQMTNEIDYDVDAYTQQLEEVVLENLEWWNTMRSKVTKLRKNLVEEEKIHQQHKN